MKNYLSAICVSLLLLVACNDSDNDKAKDSKDVSWSPPKPSEGYNPIPIYMQPASSYNDPYEMLVLRNNKMTPPVLGFPEPDDKTQRANWLKEWIHTSKGISTERGYIVAPDKGEIEVSAQWLTFEWRDGTPSGELGLYINDETTPRKSFSTHTAELLDKNLKAAGYYYGPLYNFYVKGIKVNKNDKIYFKETKSTIRSVRNCVIYFKISV